MAHSNGTCLDCYWDLGPPPNMILTIPPPPMPTFFASSFLVVGNNKSNVPCPLLCDWTTGQGIEIREELPHRGDGNEYSWYLLTISSFSIILLLGMLTTVFLMKCRQNQKMKSCLQKSTYSDQTYESILYPSMKENHVLWATLNQKGKPRAVAIMSAAPPPLPPRGPDTRSFENSAFVHLDDYSTTTTTSRYGRPHVFSPRRIEHPNMPPINFYPSLLKRHHEFPSLL